MTRHRRPLATVASPQDPAAAVRRARPAAWRAALAPWRPRRPGWEGRDRRDAGDTLLEVLFALVILGIATISLLVAFATSISASAVHRSVASFDTAIRSSSEQAISQIQQQTNPLYESCAPLSYYQTGGAGPVVFTQMPTGWQATVSGVQYWNGSSFTSNVTQCLPNSPQLITLTIKDTVDGRQFQNNFVVDDPYAPPVEVATYAKQLQFVQEPQGATAGNAFTTQPVVAVEDPNGIVVTTDLSPVTLAINPSTGTAGAALSQYCTGVENSGIVAFSNCSINAPGLNYQLVATDCTGNGTSCLTSAISTSFNVYTQLTTPTITAAIPSTTESGAINVTFTGSSNAPSGETYTVTACANSGVGFGCVTQNNFVSGTDLTGLTPGTSYYVTVTANAPTPLYLPATSAAAGPVQATVQLNAPGTPTLAFGTVAGSVSLSFATPTPAASNQTYTATACTNAAMTTGCVTGTVVPGGNLTGLSYSAGSPGTTYYADVSATASSGFLASPQSGVSSPQAAVSQVNTPTNFSTSSGSTSGSINVTFTASAGPQAPASYTATVCTNAAMTANCISRSVTAGSNQLTGLTPGTTYYVAVTANAPSAGYLNASTGVASGVLAATQLASPTGVTLGYGTVAGSVSVSFTASTNAAPTQTYSAQACTNAAMTTGCVTNANFTSGANLSGLSYTQGSPGATYYVTVTANAQTGYFASPATSALSQVETSKLNAPGTPTAVTSTSTPGGIVITFTAPTGSAPSSYTATACTNNAMTTNCLSGAITSGGTLTGLSQGGSYYVTVTANPPAGYVGTTSNVSTTPTGAATQLNTPTITAVNPSATTPGQLSIAFVGSSNAPGGQTYTAIACTNAAMTTGCVTVGSYTSGSAISLTAGSQYYVTITANASSGYLSATTAPVGPTIATVQLATPGTPTLAYGSVAGSVAVTATSSNAPAGQLYTVKACTNAAMTTGCVTTTNVLAGGNAVGLAYTQGSAGSSYYVTAAAQASSGYLASGTSAVGGPQADTSQLFAPGTPTNSPSASTAGAVTDTFTNSSGPTVGSYTAIACTNASMTTGCVTLTNYTSGSQLSGLVQGTKYYVTITAVSASPAYAAATSAVSSSALATVQLSSPTILSVTPSTSTTGQLVISYSGSTNAPFGQAYNATACTNAAMTTGCVTQTSYVSGAQFSGLTPGTNYYVTLTAPASSGYLAVTSGAVGPTLATTQLATPALPTLTYGSVAGSIAVTASSSNAPVGQLFTVKACTNSSMTTGCVTTTNVSSGGNAVGLAYTAGAAGTYYDVTVVAQPSTGYLTSATSSVAGPQPATSALATPTSVVTAPSASTVGAITATFTASSGQAPASYTATVCTNAAMTTACTTYPSDTSGANLSGLTAGTAYYTTITAVSGTSAYVSSTTSASGPTLATTQLSAPSGVTLAYGSVAGSVAVTFTGSANAAPGQTYTATACTNAAMTTGCVAVANLTSGANLSGLAYVAGNPGTSYYVTVTANPSSGYLGSAASTNAGPQAATSALAAPGTPAVASSTTVAGAVTATFTASSGTAPSSYTAVACTNAAMTAGCRTQLNYISGAQISPLTAGSSYYVQVTAVSITAAYVSTASSVSSSSALATTQLLAPTITSVASSTTNGGSITIVFTGSTNAPNGQVYIATACTNAAMTTGCVTYPSYTSGSQLSGLGQGTAYYVTLTAAASTGYLAVTTPVTGPTSASTQLATPTTPILAYGASAGSINVTTSSSNAPPGETFTIQACTNAAMTTGCVTVGTIVSGTDMTGLAYTVGSPGTSYYVTAIANAANGYLSSQTSAVAGPQADTSQVAAPGKPTVASSTTTAGAITATFTGSTGTSPASYTATACTNAAMTTGCVAQTGYGSGNQLTGLTQGTSYYVAITAQPPVGYVSNVSAVSSSAAIATTQLTSPTGVTLAYGAVPGSIAVSYTASSNAAAGQTYTVTACTNAAMTTGCVTNANLASGGTLTGLAYTQGSAGTSYYVTVTANASAAYLASPASTVAGPQAATSQLNAPSTPTVASSTTTAGAVVATFTAPTGTAPASYSAKACTNAAMTTGCVTQAGYTSGAQLTGLSAGTAYYVTITAVPGAGYTSATSAASSTSALATVQLNAPTITSVTPSSTTSGAITIAFTGASNAPGGQTYTATACTNAAMTTGCVTQTGYTSGAQLTGLTSGSSYYVTITATASAGYLAATSTVTGPVLAAIQLNAPSGVTLAYGTVAGSIAVTFTGSSNAPGGQLYTATACTNAAMTTGCVSKTSFTSGSNVTGLAYVQGSAGTSYYVTVTATASSGYLASAPSTVAGPQAATSQLSAPGTPTVASSTTTAGAVTATFSGSTGVTPASYTATACTNAAMTTGCVTQTSYVSGTQLTSLTQGTSYYVQITAVPGAGYTSATSAASASSALATVQLNAPTNVTLGYGTVAGSISITYTAPSNAPGGQTYTATACTNAAMTTGCVTNALFTSGSNLSGLSYTQGSAGTNYYVTVTANPSNGYLVSPASSVAGPQASTSQLSAPGAPTVASSTTTAGAVTATFTASSGTVSSYTATACTNAAMTTGCVTKTGYTSGAQFTGLVQGTSYYVQIIALPGAGYTTASSAVSASSAPATVQLNSPTGVTLGYGGVAGSISISFTGSSNAPGGQTYTATACTNVAMTTGCITNGSFTSGSDFTGLSYTQGSAGTNYYVTVTANASSGYLASAASSTTGPQAATSQLGAPGTPSVASSTTTAGAVTATFTAASGTVSSYTATACTNAAMTLGCVTKTGYTSGAQLTGLVQGTSYYVQITAVPGAGFTTSSSAVSASSAPATTQLNAPSITSVVSSTSSTGALTINYTGASNAPGGQTYTATACTNAAMTTGCVSQSSYGSGSQFTGLTAGTSYYATITATASSGYLAATSSAVGPTLATAQLATPTINSVSPSTTTAGALTISFTGSSNAPGGQSYTAIACTNAAMTTGCVTQTGYTTGSQLTGLTAGTSYWVTVTAVASSGYLVATTAASGPTTATIQLTTPGTPTLGYGAVAGSVTVTFTGSTNAPGGQTYTATACTNAAMTTGCVTSASFTSGATLSGLAYSPGSAGTSYYVTVKANASTGYLASAASAVAGPQAATSQLNVATGLTVAPSTTTAGAITAAFTAPTGTAPSSYTAIACTNAAMTTGCVTKTSYTTGSQLTGLTAGTSYYVTITAVAPSSAYLSSTTAVVGPTAATVQLSTPGTPTLGYGSVAGAVTVTFTGSANAPGGQTYTATACTNLAMTTGCISNAAFTSGSNLTGLAYSAGSAGTSYYVTVTANASSGYLVSSTTTAAGPQAATSQLNLPTGLTVAPSATTAGALTATFSAGAGTAPASYTAIACTNAAMTTGCVTKTSYTSASQLTGLVAGSSYYVTITAVPGSSAYLSATTAVVGPTLATVQLATPSTPVLAYGSVAGAVNVTSTSSNAPGGETYTVTACTNAVMTTGCVTNASATSGADLTGLAYTSGTAGTNYYVTVKANASSGYLASATTASAGPQADTSVLNAPTSVAASTGNSHGRLIVTFTNSTGTTPASYTANFCTNAAMTAGCVTRTFFTSGTQMSGLSTSTTYYVEVTAVAPSNAYLSATSSPPASGVSS